MKKSSSLRKKAIMSVLALSVGAASGASAIEGALKDPLFSLNEINAGTVLLAHDGEAKCGEGKCGDAKTTTVKEKSVEAKCGIKKLRKIFKKNKNAKSKTTEAKCGEGKCGSEKKN